MQIFLGADHGGYELKEQMKKRLLDLHHTVEDCGATTFDAEDDYPDFSFKVAERVAYTPGSMGILFCRSGAGVTIAANKVAGVRAVTASDVLAAQHAREDNDANVLGIAADWLKDDEAPKIIDAFLQTPFSGIERHRRRVDKIVAYEKKK